MKRIVVALVAAFVTLACLMVYYLATNRLPHPVTISYIGYEKRAPGYAIFELTNHTGSRLSCLVKVSADCTNRHIGSRSSEEPLLEPHNVYYCHIIGGTNGWRFESTLSISGPRPAWQWRLGEFLSRLGLHVASLSYERKYRTLTNKWTFPDVPE